MNRLIRANDNKNKPIIECDNPIVPHSYFNLVRLDRGQRYEYQLENHETVAVVLQGNCDILVDGNRYEDVGSRKDIWSGKADSVYAGTGDEVTIEARQDHTEIAIAGGTSEVHYDSFRIPPQAVELVEVGSGATKSHRRIFHILGHNGEGKAGNLLVSELYCEEGCWSGYPPHKHDEEKLPEESEFEETYHYRFDPDNGFGGQFCYRDGKVAEGYLTRSGDTFCFSKGYHPTVTSPGHSEYIFTILVGINQRSLVQNFEEKYRYMMDRIPGIDTMIDKFK